MCYTSSNRTRCTYSTASHGFPCLTTHSIRPNYYVPTGCRLCAIVRHCGEKAYYMYVRAMARRVKPTAQCAVGSQSGEQCYACDPATARARKIRGVGWQSSSTVWLFTQICVKTVAPLKRFATLRCRGSFFCLPAYSC